MTIDNVKNIERRVIQTITRPREARSLEARSNELRLGKDSSANPTRAIDVKATLKTALGSKTEPRRLERTRAFSKRANRLPM